jgi:polysaccharide export outer membrane protein
MSVVRYAVVVLAVVVCAHSVAGAEEKAAGTGSKWGLWNAPSQPEQAPAAEKEKAKEKEKEPPPKAEQSEEMADKDYILGPGDQLDISVWKDDELKRSLVILPDGKIAFPLIGELAAAGKTVAQLKKDIVDKLTRFIPDPVVSLEVKQVNSQIIYVLGRVNNPGRFPLNANVNVLQALATAGGFNPFARKGKVKIIRYEGDKTTVFKFDYDEVVDKETPELNFGLKRGDVIVVP